MQGSQEWLYHQVFLVEREVEIDGQMSSKSTDGVGDQGKFSMLLLLKTIAMAGQRWQRQQ